jgi:cytochrome c biogenesis protein CcdA
MKKEVRSSIHGDNSFGVAAVILGILSIIFASITGVLFGIIGLFFSAKQNQINSNVWSKWGRILSIIGIILSILTIALIIGGYVTNPELFSKLTG